MTPSSHRSSAIRAIPTSTYRLHLTGEFTLADALDVLDHVDALGVEWLYASPIQSFPEGGTHGYHILDPTSIDAELGGRGALDALSAGLAERDIGLLLDIVPNHLAASPENPWWEDLLRHGPDSAHAATFDLDASAPGPVVLPVLGTSVEEAIADKRIEVRQEEGEHRLVVNGGLSLPLAPGTDPDAPIEEVLEAQHYRLHRWDEGERVLNWRRFFAINDLVGVRVEDPEVFDLVHQLVLDLVEGGTVQGLRVDHVDGLADPGGYLERLRDAVGPGVWILVEKILEPDEDLPPTWPIGGTTGYEIATMLGCWLVDADGYQQLRDAFARRTGITGEAAAALPLAKREALRELFPGEVETVRRLLGPIQGVPDDDVATIISDMTAHLGGYRTYVPLEGDPSEADLAAIAEARGAAAVTHAHAAAAVFDALLAPEGRHALIRWQQLTGPAAAKGFEDRLLYRHVPLASLCEVGMDAHTLDHPLTPEEVVVALAERQRAWPHAGSTTSTHDTKRAEDVRARITALAELPDAFVRLLDDLREVAPDPAGDAHAPWLLTQDLLGVLDLRVSDPAALTTRLRAHAEKALREAGLRTAHREQDVEYEAAVAEWVGAVTTDEAAVAAIRRLADRMAVPGVSNALTTVAMKLAGPGVADIYRGTEVWDDSLVDPDNRRPLEVERLRQVREDLDTALGGDGDRAAAVAGLRDSWQDGRLKLHVTREGLRLRHRHPELFLDGPVEAVAADGPAADHVCALRRVRGADADGPSVIAVGTRLPHGLAAGGWPIGDVWGETTLACGDGTWTDVLTGAQHSSSDTGTLRLAEVLSTLPIAMLVTNDD